MKGYLNTKATQTLNKCPHLILLMAGLACLVISLPAYSVEQVRIGILAVRPKHITLQQWQPLVEVLTQTIPQRDFLIEPFTYNELESAVANHQVEFVITNPGHYIIMAKKYGLSSPLATLANSESSVALSKFGGVMFRRSDSVNINSLQDIKGKRVAITDTKSFGGYMVQAYELSIIGLHLPQDIDLVVTGMPHDVVVDAVLSGRADVGFVRSGVLESLIKEGKLNPDDVTLLNPNPQPNFPFFLSTRLYPEWPFSSLPNTDENLTRHVAAALFLLEENSKITRAIGIHGFVVPADYQPIDDLLRELRLPPYEGLPQFTLRDVFMRYEGPLLSGISGLAFIAFLIIRLWSANRNLKLERLEVLRQRQKLTQSETKLTTILENVDACIYMKDRQGRYIYVNRQVQEVFNASSEEIIGQMDCRFFDVSTAAKLLQDDLLVLQDNQIIRTEDTNINVTNNKISTYYTVKLPISDETGQIYALCGISTDITQIKRTEEYERFRSHILELLTEYSTLPTVLEAIVLGVEQLNPQMLCSISLLDDTGKYLVKGIAPSLPEFYNAAIDGIEIGPTAGSCGTAAFTRQRVIVSDITIHPYWEKYKEITLKAGLRACWSHPIVSIHGEVLGIFAIYFRDVHHSNQYDNFIFEQTAHLTSLAIVHKHSEKKLRTSDTALKSISQGVIITCPAQKIIWMNDAFLAITGYRKEDVLGKNCRFIQGPDTNAQTLVALRIALKRSMEFSAEILNYRKDGSSFWNDLTISPTFDEQGQLTHFVGIIRDITERKRSEIATQEAAKYVRNLIEASLDPLVTISPAGKITDANAATELVTGVDREILIGSDFDTYFTDRDNARRGYEQVIANGQVTGYPLAIQHQSGQITDVLYNASLYHDSHGNVVGIFAAARDISEIKRSEEKLQLAASVFTTAREGIMITTPNAIIIDVNMAFCRITGYSREEVIGANPKLLSSGHHDKSFYASLWNDLIEKNHWYGEVWNRRKNGEFYASMQNISAVIDKKGNTRHYVAIFSDVTTLKEHEQELEHIAHYDALTGLPNRALLADRLKQGMAQVQRLSKPLAVAYLDLDGFKAINDTYGHEAGDQLLIAVTAHINSVLREGDTLARLGGDEFIAVLHNLGDIESSVEALTRILAAAAQPVHIGSLKLQVSASLGVTFYPQSTDIDADQLLRQADQAMYVAKQAGKNRYHVFDAEQDNNIRDHYERLAHIREAMYAQEFVLHYQPKVNMRSGKVIGTEALIRWQHPKEGLLSPIQFLPIIEDHPLSIELGEWVINTVLTQMENWQLRGLSISVSINIGARQLQQPDFVERLRKNLAAHPTIIPGRLELEVLETSALQDLAKVSRIIHECKEIGIKFALDDFGTGYSSLTYLKHLPASQLKIDQSFVQHMLEDNDDLAIVKGVIGLATAFHREVIAEGVETILHGERLLQLSCELAQGYGIARPMPAEQIPRWITAWKPDPSWSFGNIDQSQS